jgi:hypothetical protein
LREPTPQRHERRPIRSPKGCKNGARKQNKDTFTAPVFKLDFEVVFLRDSNAKLHVFSGYRTQNTRKANVLDFPDAQNTA